MLTIKLPYKLEQDIVKDIELISDYIRIQSSMIRFIFNRLAEDLDRKTITSLCSKTFSLDSWFIQSAYIKAKALFLSNNKKKIFGNKHNFKLRSQGKISKEIFKTKRMLPLHIEGESPKFGNRKFNLDIMENNNIIFKPKHGIKIKLLLPNLRKNIKNQLFTLETLTKNKQTPYTVELSSTHIFISFEINEIQHLKNIIGKVLTKKETRAKAKLKLDTLLKNTTNRNQQTVLGIDMNPNYLGFTVIKFDKENNFEVLHKEYIDFKLLNKNSKDKVYKSNKKKFETIESVKYILKIAKQFNVSKLVIEDLVIKVGNKNIGKNFNRLTNNVWHRNLIVGQLTKRCVKENIELVKVNCAYSSTVGNVLFGSRQTPDAIASAIEIARRGYKKFSKNWFYPSLPSKERLENLWKEDLVGMKFKTWVELHKQIKESKLMYRFPHVEAFASEVLSHKSLKSLLKRVKFSNELF